MVMSEIMPVYATACSICPCSREVMIVCAVKEQPNAHGAMGATTVRKRRLRREGTLASLSTSRSEAPRPRCVSSTRNSSEYTARVSAMCTA